MEDIPDWTFEGDDENHCWRNIHNHTIIGVVYDDGIDKWVVTGENSRLYTADTQDGAVELAREFMLDTRRPSPMV